MIHNLVIRRLRHPHGVVQCNQAQTERVFGLEEVQLRVGKIDIGLGDVKFRFCADLEKRFGLFKMLLELSHDLSGDVPVTPGLEKPVVGLLDCEDHLDEDVIEIRTEGVPIEFLDLHLCGCFTEIIDVLAQGDAGGVTVVALTSGCVGRIRPAVTGCVGRIRSAVTGGSVQLRIKSGARLAHPAFAGCNTAGGRLDAGMPLQGNGDAALKIQRIALPDQVFRADRRRQKQQKTDEEQKPFFHHTLPCFRHRHHQTGSCDSSSIRKATLVPERASAQRAEIMNINSQSHPRREKSRILFIHFPHQDG